MHWASMKALIRRLLLAAAGALAFTASPAGAQEQPASLVLVTIDGVRWQDLFGGADPTLVADEQRRARYVDVPDRVQALMPFLSSFARDGALIGDRNQGSCARVANAYWFSYPGYAEILSGRPNPRARSNQDIANDDVTVLERLARRPDFAGQVAAFAEWSVVPAILNVERSGLPVFIPPDPGAPHDPQVIAAVRTAFAAPPRLAWIALGDTDTSAHAGDYGAYLDAAAQADAFLQELWQTIEADPRRAGRTTLIVTTDHGRGESRRDRWRGHGSGRWRGMVVPFLRREGSDAIFIGVRGPGVVSTNAYTLDNCATAGQVAATMLSRLNVLAEEGQADMAAPLAVFDDGALGATP